MNYYHIFLLLIAIFQTSFAQSRALDSIADKYLEEYRIPGLAISVIKPDTIYYGVAGTKRIGSSDKIDIQSKFQIASNTKSITATIAAMLVEENYIQWDSKIIDIVPELNANVRPEYEDITLVQLLSNRAKIQPFESDNSKEWKNIPKTIKTSKNSKLDFAKYALNLKPKINSEKNHSYSNGGFIISALLMERATMKTWESLVKEFNERFEIDASIGFPNQTNSLDTYGHKKKFGTYKPIEASDEYKFDFDFSAAGNLSISIADLSKVMAQHLDGLLGNDNILSSVTYDKLHYSLDAYALGWYNGFIGESKQKFSYHGGSLETFSSAIILSADRKIGVIILVNADDKNVEELKTKLRKELWETYGTYLLTPKNQSH